MSLWISSLVMIHATAAERSGSDARRQPSSSKRTLQPINLAPAWYQSSRVVQGGVLPQSEPPNRNAYPGESALLREKLYLSPYLPPETPPGFQRVQVYQR